MRTAHIRRMMKRLTTYLEWTVLSIFRLRRVLLSTAKMIACKPAI